MLQILDFQQKIKKQFLKRECELNNMQPFKKERKRDNHDWCSSTGQTLNLFSRDHQFEPYKLQGHWRQPQDH